MKLIVLSALIGACAAALLPSPASYLTPRQAPSNNYLPPDQSAFRSSGQEYNARPRAALERNAAILRSDAEVNENGFHYAYETENGIQAQEVGQEADGIQAQGGYSYTGDDGQVYSVQYSAGAGGFQVQGAHIPTPPPVPEEIARALEQNAADEAKGIFDDGSYKGEGAVASNAGYSYSGPTAAAPAVIAARTQPSRQYLAPQSGFRSQSGYHY